MKRNILLLMLGVCCAYTLQAQVMISEIMYNNAGADDLEFVELLNHSDFEVNLEGYTFSSGINYTFGALTLESGAYVVVCADSTLMDAVFGIAAYEWDSGALTNSGELIELSDADGNIVDAVDYDDASPWSNFADGNGPSIVLCDPNTDNSDAANWQAATTDTGITYSNVPLLANPGAASNCSGISLLSLEEFELSVNEDVGVINMAVEIENASSMMTTVSIEINAVTSADPASDFSLSTMELVFPANSTEAQSFDISITDDMELEPTEQITLVLRNPSNGAIILTDSLNITIGDNDTPLEREMILTGVYDAQLPGMAGSKGFEVFVLNDIDDLSVYGIGVANNGGGTDGLEWNFPFGSATAGEFLYIAEDSTEFHDYFGFAPTYVAGVAAVNGDDAVELYENSQVIDVYGEVEGTPTAEWNYQDGWASRRLGTGPDGSTFVLNNWIISGEDALDGAETNATAPTPFPIGTYSIPTMTTAQNDAVEGAVNTPVIINVLGNDFILGTVASVVPILGSGTSGAVSVNTDNTITYTPAMDFCGTDSFNYEVCDETDCSQATVTITIACPPSYPAYTIAQVTTNDATGLADSMGISCALSGRVYGVNIKNDGGLSFVVIDAAGDGIVAFSDAENFGYTVNEGDEVTVTGTIDQYNGLTELILDGVEITTLGIDEVAPTVVTTLDESTESQLVTIENLFFVDPEQWDSANGSSGFNVQFYRIDNPSDTIIVRIDNDVDLYNFNPLSVLYDSYTITGLGGQFDFTSPYDSGYQILPRYESDISGVSVSTNEATFDFTTNIFPNPTSKYLFVQSEEVIEQVRISNALGQTIYSMDTPNMTQRIDVSAFAKGIYTVTMKKDGVRVAKQVSIQ